MNPVSFALHYKSGPCGKTNFDNSNAVWFGSALNAKKYLFWRRHLHSLDMDGEFVLKYVIN